MAVVDRLVGDFRLRLREKRFRENLPQPLRAARTRRARRLFLGSQRAALVAGQVEARDFSDDRIAADADLGRDLAAGEAGLKMHFQGFNAFGGPSLYNGGHEFGSRFDPFGIVLTCAEPKLPCPKISNHALPLSRMESSPSLIASLMPSSISVLATPGTLVPWVPCLTSLSRKAMVESAKVTGMRSVSAFSVAMTNASPLLEYRKVTI